MSQLLSQMLSRALERPAVAAKRIGISVSQLYREVKACRLAPPIKIGKRASAFPAEDIDRFIADRIREGRKAQQGSDAAPAVQSKGTGS